MSFPRREDLSRLRVERFLARLTECLIDNVFTNGSSLTIFVYSSNSPNSKPVDRAFAALTDAEIDEASDIIRESGWTVTVDFTGIETVHGPARRLRLDHQKK